MGEDAYPDLFTKAASLLHSLARNHPLVDGNKRLAWLATYVVAVASGEMEDVDEIAVVLRSFAGRPPASA